MVKPSPSGVRKKRPEAQPQRAVAAESGRECRAVRSDITRRKQAESRQALLIQILEVLNRPSGISNLAREILKLVKHHTSIGAVGIRLRQGEDFPYLETNGLSPSFVEKERSLCARGPDGKILRDPLGQPVLECMCGNILRGQTDPSQPFFTTGGSFWTNSAERYVGSSTAGDSTSRLRNHCQEEGYESVALIPLRSGDEIVGLLQLNDKRPNQFTPEMIEFMEGLGSSIGIGVARSKSLEALKESQTLVRAVIDGTSDAVYVKDAQGRYLLFNEAAREIIGRSLDGVTDPAEPLLFPSGVGMVEKVQDLALLKAKKSVTVEETLTTAAGENRTYLSTKGPLVDDRGQAYGLFAIARDITERKRWEEELKASHERYQGLFENAAIGIFQSLPEGRFLRVNPAMASLLGYESPEELVSTITDIQRQVYVDSAKHSAVVGSVLGRNGWFQTENHYRRKDGTTITANLFARRVLRPDGTLAYLEGFVEDITDRKRLAERISGMNLIKERLLNPISPSAKLKLITDGIVDIFGADFARVWMIKESDLCQLGCPHSSVLEGPHVCRDRTQCLHLVASSGRYTHLNGGHRRVPLGVYRIGRGGTGEEPKFYTNEASRDPRVHDHAWAASLGLVSYAGFQLLSTAGKPVGVLALFSQKEISTEELGLFEDMANSASQVIQAGQAEEALRESEERFKGLFEDAVLGLYRTTPDGWIEMANPALCRMLGYDSVEELRRRNLEKEGFHPGYSREHFKKDIEEKGVIIGLEASWTTNDGRIKHVRESARAVKDVSGKVLFYEGSVEDVTEHHQALEALRESEERFRQLAENMSSGVVVYETQDDGRSFVIRDFNPAAERIESIAQKKVLGRSVVEVFPGVVDLGLFEVFQRVWKTGQPEHLPAAIYRDQRIIGWRENYVYRLPSGEVVAVYDDVTERKKAEEEIRQSNILLEDRVRERTALLEATNQELEAFCYSVSHDLRAPLRTIDGFGLALLEECGSGLGERGQHYLQRVRSAAQNMELVINDLLKLSRVTRAEMSRGRVNLSRVVEKLAKEFQESIPDRSVKWVIAPGVTCDGDERLLESALRNLLENALKFTSKHPAARIEFGVLERDGQAVYFVRDDGAGFDMSYSEKLFGVFQRLHRSEEFEGTGVGLATVQRIIRRHGGRIWAEGAVEQGATFYFSLTQPLFAAARRKKNGRV